MRLARREPGVSTARHAKVSRIFGKKGLRPAILVLSTLQVEALSICSKQRQLALQQTQLLVGFPRDQNGIRGSFVGGTAHSGDGHAFGHG